MDPVLRIDADEEMDVVRHGLELDELETGLGVDLANDLFQSSVDVAPDGTLDEHRAPILRAPQTWKAHR
jgi:hypothetical protein